MDQDLKRFNLLVIKPTVVMLILAAYFAGLFNGSF